LFRVSEDLAAQKPFDLSAGSVFWNPRTAYIEILATIPRFFNKFFRAVKLNEARDIDVPQM
jgi:hypothetical protein